MMPATCQGSLESCRWSYSGKIRASDGEAHPEDTPETRASPIADSKPGRVWLIPHGQRSAKQPPRGAEPRKLYSKCFPDSAHRVTDIRRQAWRPVGEIGQQRLQCSYIGFPSGCRLGLVLFLSRVYSTSTPASLCNGFASCCSNFLRRCCQELAGHVSTPLSQSMVRPLLICRFPR